MALTAIAFVLGDGPDAARTATALQLIEALQHRGHRVTVYARDHAVALSAAGTGSAELVSTLLRRGVHTGTLDWVVDEQAAAALGVAGRQVPGVLPGGPADLWAFVRAADVVLAPGRGGG